MFDSWHFLKSLDIKGKNKRNANKAIFNLINAEDKVEYIMA